MITAEEAITRLKDGNRRFVDGVRSIETILKQQQRADLVNSQAPFAVVLGCSDSRVPAELIFDQGLGDLFVIRIAGNIVAPSQIGSVEFAVEQFDTPLVVILGHSMCGAVSATIERLQGSSEKQSSNVLSIINRIRPAVEPLMETELRNDPGKLMEAAIKSNIHASVSQLRHGSQKLEQLIDQGKITVVGAEYCLETGIVEFFDRF